MKMFLILSFGFLLFFDCSKSQERLQQAIVEPYFSVNPEDHKIAEGLPVRLRCEAEPKNEIKYSWKIDGQILIPNPRRHQIGSDLVISRVDRLLDSGSFVCVANHEKSGMTIESSPAKIDVQWISEASVQLQQPKPEPLIRAGGRVELRCHVDGSGELKYEWFRNTRSITPNKHLEMHKNLLIISEVNTEDNGVYRCLARNDGGVSPIAHTLPLIVPSNETATLKVAPQKSIVRRGESASFSCVFDNADRIQWFHEEKGPIDSDDEKIVMDNGTLLIVQVKDTDKGYYSCHGVKDETAQVYSAELQIAYLKNLSVSSFEPILEDQLAVVGNNQELQVTCLKPGGLPEPKVFWKDPQGRIISDTGPIRIQDDTLIVAKARPQIDEGNFTCVAENIAGATQMSVRVVVSWPPELHKSPESLTVAEDESATFTCTFKAMESPITHTTWLKDGEHLRDINSPGGSLRHKVIQKSDSSSLIFNNVHVGDKGSYACEILTKGYPPIRSKPATLKIKEKLKFSPEPVNRKLELNSTAKISCKAQGSSPITLKWHKVGTKKLPKHVQDQNGTLHFNGVVESDKGNYTCIATNNQGQINHTIKIEVVIAPKFTIRPENVTGTEGQPLWLHCAAEGDPKPAIQWDKDSRMNSLETDRFIVMPNGSLYIKEVYLSDEGKYGCTAGNNGGFKREEVHLSVRAVDGYRSDLDVDNSEDSMMMTKTVIITLGAAVAYMVLVIGLMWYCRYRRRKRKQRYLQEQTEAQEKGENEGQEGEQCELRETSNHPSTKRKEPRESHKSDGNDTAHSQTSNHSRRSKSNYDKLSVSRSHLQEFKPLGRGEFGEIFSSRYKPPSSDDGSTVVKESIVMIKKLSNTKDETILQEFKRHLDLLNKLNHENVAKLVGLCRDEEPDYMILEYTDWGDLKTFLVASKAKDVTSTKDGGKPRAPQLTVPQILSLSNQAARGLKHVADHRLIHKDVAARNCLISSNFTLKISLSCMSKEPHQQEYTKYRNQIIPLRWLPKEAVFEDDYSTKSDVYSYSCLVWEMFHQGELPFKKHNDESVLNQLKSQTLTWNPHKAAPPDLQELQKQCWSYDPRQRPTFDQICDKLQDIVTECAKI